MIHLVTDRERVISAAEAVCGDHAKAVGWLSQPLDVFDGKTPLQLIADGRAESVIGYLHSIASGFAG